MHLIEIVVWGIYAVFIRYKSVKLTIQKLFTSNLCNYHVKKNI